MRIDNLATHRKKGIKLDMLTDEEIRQYDTNSEEELTNKHLNHSLLLCEDTTCKDPQHVSAINRMYSDIVDAFIESSKFLVRK